MTSALFSLSFLLAAPFWALMIVLPHWSWTRRIVASPWIVAPPALVYAVLVLPHLGTFLPAVSSPTLPGVQGLLGTAGGAAAGWAHFIAFDLLAGRWIYLDSRERAMPALLTAPVLLLTILFGPLGLLAHLALRTRWAPAEPRPALQDA
ncbi:ABA4-like family protein [Spirilliplanes yamanashiensis]|uniref:DUF4281 domain-containing protein n=1 Tax=Spirilliplanes yamanashiensis TaxID=42233 RepID=A0A8J3YAV7_9ACTN|nr:ABA4-like family protein [Spirilliplanes yamanashiensis]MDP9817714.1 hypothetical protein [Spirilliplanes yamanashiensis]GIJ04524.1 hypothetical protein Sya03_38760 [Spirilliplanes yamanashiensis]